MMLIISMTTITISKETRDRLATIGAKDSTFDDIIKNLIKSWRNDS